MSSPSEKSVLARQVELLQGLCDALEEEKGFLISSDLKGLRRVSERKEELIRQLSKLQKEDVEKGKAREAREMKSKIDSLKLEIRLRAQENRQFVCEMLDFIEGLIGVIAGSGAEPGLYGKTAGSPEKPTLIYRAQV